MDDDARHGERVSAPSNDTTPTEDANEALLEVDTRPTVEHRAWLRQDDYWKRTTYIAATGRHTRSAPKTRQLPRPKRFRGPTPIRSSLTFVLIVALIVLVPIGVIRARSWAESHIVLPSTIPGISQPTATHTATPAKSVKKTPTPKK